MSWIALLIGMLIGVASGIVGIGGGILFVPFLVWTMGMNQHKAQGTSLAALLAPVGLLAVWEYYRRGWVDVRIALWLATGFLVGGLFGAVAAQHVSDYWLRKIFAAMLFAIGAKMWFSR